MNIVTNLQELDRLIIEHTNPPVTAMLRNKLFLALEQAEAHSDAVAKQEQTLSRQVESYEHLLKEKEEVDAENLSLKAEIARRDSDDESRFSGSSGGYIQ